MFWNKEVEPSQLDDVIANLQSDLVNTASGSKEFTDISGQLADAVKLKEALTPKSKIDWNTVLIVGANILVAVLIINHERTNVITSKAMGFVSKLR